MRTFLAALSMLTICPLGRFNPTEAELRRSIHLFPLVGVVVGAVAGLAAWGVTAVLPGLAGAMALALMPEIFTKGFHLDGLADTADGFLSGRPRDKKLEIMRDSHIGTMGVLAIVALIGTRFALYAEMEDSARITAAWLAALAGRCGVVWYIGFSRYARPSGLGGLWFGGRKPLAGMLLGAVLCIGAGCYLWGIWGVLCGVAVVAAARLWAGHTRRVIGGATGDTIGCFEELAELLAPVALFFMPV